MSSCGGSLVHLAARATRTLGRLERRRGRRGVLRRGRFLEEPEWLLRSEVKETARYSAILGAIAAGCTKSGEIKSRVGEGSDGREIFYYIERLKAMRLVDVVK